MIDRPRLCNKNSHARLLLLNRSTVNAQGTGDDIWFDATQESAVLYISHTQYTSD